MASDMPLWLQSTREEFGPEPPPLRLTEKPNKGRAMITTETIEMGQEVLHESPLFMYPASLASLPSICSHCFVAPSSEKFPCIKCNVARFCSTCSHQSHPDILCRALPSLITGNYTYPDDLIYPIAAYSLPPSSFTKVFHLPSISILPEERIDILYNQLSSLFIDTKLMTLGFNRSTTSILMSMRNDSSFALPPYGGDEVRAYGIYLWTSMVNHDCRPSAYALKFQNDYVLIALHKIEKGGEICINYLDDNYSMGYEERQRKLLKRFGFKCKCEKCESESKWMHKKEDKDTGDDQEEIGTDVSSGGEEVKPY